MYPVLVITRTNYRYSKLSTVATGRVHTIRGNRKKADKLFLKQSYITYAVHNSKEQLQRTTVAYPPLFLSFKYSASFDALFLE